MAFVNLHVHTYYSLLDGLGSPKQLVERAVTMGQNALAITDHGVMYGAADHYKECEKAGIKPIIGCEVYVTPDHTIKDKAVLNELPFDNCHLILLAKNNDGHENLRRIVAASMLNGFYYKPRVDHKLLKEYGSGLIALSGCLAGEIPQLLLRGNYETAKELAIMYNDLFDAFFLEVQANRIPEQHAVNELMYQLSTETGIPLVATCDTHFVKKDDGKIHKNFTILGSRDSKKEDNWDKIYLDCWLKSEEEMLSMVPAEAVNNTQVIADMCNITVNTGSFHLPEFKIPEGYTLDTYLSKLCQDGLFHIALEKDIDVDPYIERLIYELSIIKQKGLSGYFLIVQDLVNEAKRRGIFVGPGRGSAAGSLISYTLGITSVDPLEHGLLFERFINPDRPSMPDIDVDFEDDRRGEMLDYLVGKYGAANVCQVITFGTLKSRMVLKDAARILDVDFDTINAITKQIPVIEGKPYTIQQAIDNIPDVATAAETYPELFELGQQLEGVPRQAGTHAAGVVITPDALVKYIPLCRGKEGEVVSQFAKDTLEDMGLLKFDLLGLKTLTVMRLALQNIKDRHGKVIDLNKLPLNDSETLKLISQGKTIGVFQLESEGMQRIFKDLNSVTFQSLVAGVSLYRPGPMSLIPVYTGGANGTRHVDYLVPELEPILNDTFGVILYQEQTMRIATDLAGYTPSQSDMLRKAIGKKKREVMESELSKLVNGSSEDSIPGMIAKSIPPAAAEQIASMIEKFAGYGFNKSHATGYALLAYQSAYLKAHYPLEFMTALLTVAKDNSEKMTRYAHEAKRMGIGLLPPDINSSGLNFTIDGNSIRFALSAVKNVGPNVATKLLEARPFENIEDMINRMEKKHLNKKVLASLSLCGALDRFGDHRMTILANALSLREDKEDFTEKIKTFDERAKLKHEEELLGLFVSGHPLHKIAKPVAWDDINDREPFEVYGLVVSMKTIVTKKGDPMCIMTMETLEGTKTVFVFTQVYATCKDELKEGQIIKIKLVKDKPGLIARSVYISKKYNKK